jgi:hypothetical protein
MSQRDLVAMLRASARRQVTQTSVYMGVSLLRQTGRWHSQISWHTTISSSRESILNLGYYASEEAAARAYDRAALIKATTTAAGSDPEMKSEKDDTNDANEQEQEEEARPSSSARPLHSAERASTPPALNFPPSNYASDAQLPAALLLSALTGDSTRKLVMDMLENGISEEGIGHLNRMLTEGGGGGGGGGENQKRKIKGVNGNGGGLNDGCGEGNNSGGDDDGGSDDGGGGGIVKGQAAAIVEAAIAAEGRLGALLANGSHPNNMQLHTPPVLFNSMLEVGGGLLSSGNGGGGGSESSRKRRKTTRPARSHAN